MNSADSPVYTKKAILYGLDRAWREIRRSKLAVLVEGYFDVISLHQAGVPQAVAACGTAFSSDQAKLLGRYTERVCVVTDGDAAGQKAAVRAAGVLLTVGLRPSVLAMPQGDGFHDFGHAVTARLAGETIDDPANQQATGGRSKHDPPRGKFADPLEQSP